MEIFKNLISNKIIDAIIIVSHDPQMKLISTRDLLMIDGKITSSLNE
jgi:ABC-type lipoprotein export system ATPase subunit